MRESNIKGLTSIWQLILNEDEVDIVNWRKVREFLKKNNIKYKERKVLRICGW